MGKFPYPHLFKITIQSKPLHKVWPSKGEGTENATACRPNPGERRRGTNSTENGYFNGKGVHYPY